MYTVWRVSVTQVSQCPMSTFYPVPFLPDCEIISYLQIQTMQKTANYIPRVITVRAYGKYLSYIQRLCESLHKHNIKKRST